MGACAAPCSGRGTGCGRLDGRTGWGSGSPGGGRRRAAEAAGENATSTSLYPFSRSVRRAATRSFSVAASATCASRRQGEL